MDKPLRKIIGAMCGREGMYVKPPDWNNIVSFIHGFCAGIEESGGPKELEEFQSWLEAKVGYKSSSGWTWIIEREIAGGDSKKAISAFYELWSEFIDTN